MELDTIDTKNDLEMIRNGKLDGKIVCGNCLDVMADMPDECVDLVVTDPPYGIGFKSGGAKTPRFDILNNDDEEFDLTKYWRGLYRVTKSGGALYLYCRWDVAHKWSDIVNPDSQIVIPRGRCSMGDLTNYSTEYEVVLFKRKGKHVIDATPLKIPNNSHTPDPPPFKKRIGNLWLDVISNEAWEHAIHPTQKTIQSVSKMIIVSSSEGNLIFDPFMGSGTTAIAALKLERHFYGCDISLEYVELANKRIEKTRLEMAQLSFSV